MKKLFTLIIFMILAPLHAAELGTYPTLNLSKLAGVDSGSNVGLALVASLPCSASIANPALYYNGLSGLIGCSTQVAINDTTISVLPGGTLNFADGGFSNQSAFQITVPTTITVATIGFGATQETGLTVLSQSNGFALSLANLPTFGTGTKGSLIKLSAGASNDPASIDYTWNGSFQNTVCVSWGGVCKFSMLEGGGFSTGSGTLSGAGSIFGPALTFSNCGNRCGFYAPAANQLGIVAAGGDILDYGITSAGNLTINIPLGLPGYTVATLPTGVKGQIAFVTDATACTYGGALTGSSTNYCKVQYNGSAWVGG